ncbi:hypothetical protein BT96DRAFT_988233 [Gymnopus androsaceus JB14]|uniref:Uncharacterized protein n=1 Tax=Gymnopus androsaceus JB14 TaxID=1447944 RepID=A0A6A4I9I4_9AGAR|nr:hypothetical protein BT96DRAFT_988233 [Gymnopus androsaceus JB14]
MTFYMDGVQVNTFQNSPTEFPSSAYHLFLTEIIRSQSRTERRMEPTRSFFFITFYTQRITELRLLQALPSLRILPHRVVLSSDSSETQPSVSAPTLSHVEGFLGPEITLPIGVFIVCAALIAFLPWRRRRVQRLDAKRQLK